MEQIQEIFLIDLLKSLIKQVPKMIIGGIVGVVLAALLTFFAIKPMYTASIDVLVRNNENTLLQEDQNPTHTTLTLINTYKSLIKKPFILEPTLEEVGSDMSAEKLADRINISSESNALAFSIEVLDESPYRASDLANALAKNFDEKIPDDIDVMILSDAEPNENPISPNISRNLLLGGIVGAGLVFVAVFIQILMDTRIRNPHIVEEMDWVLLGTVLEIPQELIEDSRLNESYTASTSSRRRV